MICAGFVIRPSAESRVCHGRGAVAVGGVGPALSRLRRRALLPWSACGTVRNFNDAAGGPRGGRGSEPPPRPCQVNVFTACDNSAVRDAGLGVGLEGVDLGVGLEELGSGSV